MNKNGVLIDDFEKIISSEIIPGMLELKGKTFLITGISGMIGEYLTRFLMYLNSRYSLNIHVIGLFSRESKSDEKYSEFVRQGYLKIIKEDIRNIDSIQDKIDYIIHAAGITSPYAYEHLPADVATTTILGTWRMIELSRSTGAAMLLLSSSSIYGAVEGMVNEYDYGPLDPLEVRSCYSEGKRASEMLCVAYNCQHGVNSRIVRCRRVYGPTANFRVKSLLNKLLLAAANNETIELFRDSGNKIQLVYVGDAITGLLKVLLCGNPGEAYNICSDPPISVDRLAEKLSAGGVKTGNLNINWKTREEINDEVRIKKQENRNNATCVNNKLRSLGWRPLFSLDEGLDNTIRFLSAED